MSGQTIGSLLCEAGAALREAGIADARAQARVLLAHVLGRPPLTLPGDAQEGIGGAPTERFRALLARRCAHEPLAYLLGRRGFWTLDLAVTPAVLIPRPDSETLIEAALSATSDRAAVRRVLDLGTGSGALLLAMLAECPAAFGVGVDSSEAALAVARGNAHACGLADRAGFVCAHWADALHGCFDIVLCNPPYIETATICTLEPDVAAHEPHAALDGGADGHDAYRAIMPVLPRLLHRGAIAVVELGAGQAASVSALARAAGFGTVQLRQDLGGIPRALLLRC